MSNYYFGKHIRKDEDVYMVLGSKTSVSLKYKGLLVILCTKLPYLQRIYRKNGTT